MKRKTTRTWLLAISLSLLAGLALKPGLAAAGGSKEHGAKGHAHDEEGEGEESKSSHPGEEKGHAEDDEGINLAPESQKQFGVTVLAAGPEKLNVTLPLTGKLVPHEDRVAHITPRFSGVMREVKKRLGDTVARGETVATIENNQTLQTYEVKSQIPGTIVRRHATIGESVNDTTTLFDVADYSELFADLFVFPADHQKVRMGQRVLIRIQGKTPVESVVTFLSPVTDADTQSRFVRAVVPNPTGELQSGSFILGDVVLEETNVPIAVDNSALRTNEGKTVVFVEEAQEHFEARPVVTGRKDKDSTEILSGMRTGERYAAGNTFILQAEMEKGEAEHEH